MLNVGAIELLFVLVVWALPLALVVWFVLAIRDIRESLRNIERHMQESGRFQRRDANVT